MAYDFYLDKTRLPVTPGKLQVKINGKNKTVTLINEGEINILKKPGLTDINFAVLFPNMKYPFAEYDDGFKNASYYLDMLEKLKTQVDDNGKLLPFQFIVSRVLPNGTVLFNTNIKVALQDYKISDDTKNGFDIAVDITLKQYKSYGTKTVEVVSSTEQATTVAVTTPITMSVESPRPAEKLPTQSTHPVTSSDTLWTIAQQQLGDGNRYPEIYELNKAVIDADNRGTNNTKYTIHSGQVLIMPS